VEILLVNGSLINRENSYSKRIKIKRSTCSIFFLWVVDNLKGAIKSAIFSGNLINGCSTKDI
jgi:hypothetical protein